MDRATRIKKYQKVEKNHSLTKLASALRSSTKQQISSHTTGTTKRSCRYTWFIYQKFDPLKVIRTNIRIWNSKAQSANFCYVSVTFCIWRQKTPKKSLKYFLLKNWFLQVFTPLKIMLSHFCRGPLQHNVSYEWKSYFEKLKIDGLIFYLWNHI